MKKIINSENFAEIMQIMIKVHHKHPELRFMQIIGNVLGINDPYYTTNEQLLELLHQFYATEIKK
jgi:hypothetical protein